MAIKNFQDFQPSVAEGVYVDEQALVVGQVTIGNDSSVWPMAVVRGDVNAIKIGEGTNIQDGSILHVTHESDFFPGGYSLSIGNAVTIGHHVVLHGCSISHNCLIGMHSTILDGAFLEPKVLLAAGSIVPPGKHLEGGFLWLGNPVKRMRPLTESEKDFFEYSAQHYINLKNKYQQP